VPEDVAGIDERPEYLVQMQVRAADPGRGDLDDRSVGPGISDVIVTPVSSSSLCSARAKDCTNDLDAL